MGGGKGKGVSGDLRQHAGLPRLMVNTLTPLLRGKRPNGAYCTRCMWCGTIRTGTHRRRAMKCRAGVILDTERIVDRPFGWPPLITVLWGRKPPLPLFWQPTKLLNKENAADALRTQCRLLRATVATGTLDPQPPRPPAHGAARVMAGPQPILPHVQASGSAWGPRYLDCCASHTASAVHLYALVVAPLTNSIRLPAAPWVGARQGVLVAKWGEARLRCTLSQNNACTCSHE